MKQKFENKNLKSLIFNLKNLYYCEKQDRGLNIDNIK